MIRQHDGQNPQDAVPQTQVCTDGAQALKGLLRQGQSWDTSPSGTQGECMTGIEVLPSCIRFTSMQSGVASIYTNINTYIELCPAKASLVLPLRFCFLQT